MVTKGKSRRSKEKRIHLWPFKALLIDLAYMYCGSIIDKSDFYFQREHLNVVKSLHYNNILISKPDKSVGVVIFDQEYYNKMADVLKTTTKFKILGSVDKTTIEKQSIKRELIEYYKNILYQKRFTKKYAQSDHKDHVCMDSPKYTKYSVKTYSINGWLCPTQHR